jgi:hypothetical protein
MHSSQANPNIQSKRRRSNKEISESRNFVIHQHFELQLKAHRRSHRYNTPVHDTQDTVQHTTLQGLQLQASAPVLGEEVHFLKGFPTKQYSSR